MTTDRIFNYTREELALIKKEAGLREERKKEVAHCLWCDKEMYRTRRDKKFCSAAHRALFHAAAAQVERARLIREREAWLAEREELVREVAMWKGLASSRGA